MTQGSSKQRAAHQSIKNWQIHATITVDALIYYLLWVSKGQKLE